jgi:CheY-like chemotaxis protein
MARILLIEDDRQVRQVLEGFLTMGGHEVHVAENGKIAKIAIQEDGVAFDLVITDMVMPETDGFEVITFLRSLPAPPRIIAISGGGIYLDEDLLLRIADRMNVNAVLHKPVTYDSFMSTVTDVLQWNPAVIQ